jgi:hypothetical protein
MTMIKKNRVTRAAGSRRRTLAVVVCAIAPLAMLGLASPALATEHHPKGEFAQFANCPLSNPSVADCVLAESNAGKFKVGNRTVPINKTITLQGGVANTGEFLGAEDGNTLAKVALTVPGGLLGIVAPKTWPEWLQNLFNEFINKGFTGVTATTEVAGPASGIVLDTQNLLNQEGTALSLPTKIKLDNVLLGEKCYIGSNTAPVVINFTTGTSGKLTGVVGELTFNEEFTLVTISGGKLVNNTFKAPGVEGCGILPSLIDPLVNSALGLPAGEGVNEAILEGKLQVANAAAVKASE